MAEALRLLDASTAIPIDFFRAPLVAVVGFYFYGESIDIWLLVGAGMIIGSNYHALRNEARGLKSRLAPRAPRLDLAQGDVASGLQL